VRNATGARPGLYRAGTGAADAAAAGGVLGEIHDNAAQHAVRAQALEQLLQAGLRPALAFEQFDRERQSDIDRVRKQPARSELESVRSAW